MLLFSLIFASDIEPTPHRTMACYYRIIRLLFFLKIGINLPAQTMILIPGGTFSMGDIMQDSLYPDERPLHRVVLRDFYLAASETTFEEFDAFCTASGRALPSDNGWGRGQQPVFHTDWYDAVEYCNWLSTKNGLQPCYTIDKSQRDSCNTHPEDTKKWMVVFQPKANGYRLPTEAEWEFAARAFVPEKGLVQGGGPVRFANGTDVADPAALNFRADSAFRKKYAITGLFRQKTIPINALPPNPLGLYQMSGNVFEWCQDWYGEHWYDYSDNSTAPQGPKKGSTKVARGGSWYSQAAFCRTTYRFDWAANTRCTLIGFRVARNRL